MARRHLRRLLNVALAGAALALAGLVAVNVYLNTEYLPRLIQSEQDWLTVEYNFAWSVWPGRVHLEGLRVRGDEKALSWEVRARRAKVVADLSGLSEQQLVIDQLKLSHVTAKLRPRLHYLDAAEDYVQHLAPVPTTGPEFLLEGPDALAKTRVARAPWRVRLSHLQLDGLRELWVDRFRFEGRLDAEGAVEVAEGRVLSAGPVSIEVHDGAVMMDGARLVEALRGAGISSLGPVDLSAEGGLSMLASLSGDADLSGEVVSLDFLPRLDALPVPIALAGVKGPVHTRVSLKDGAVLPGAELTWEAKDAVAQVEGFQAQGALTLRAEVVQDQGRARTRCTATLNAFALGKEGRLPLAQGRSASLTLDAPNVAFRDPAGFSSALKAALSQWPGRLELEGVRVVSQERSLEWEARIDELASKLDVGALAQRRVRFQDAKVRGIAVRIRPRLLPSEATAEAAKYFPQLSGLPQLAVRTQAQPPSIAARAAANPWSVQAENATVEGLRELWVDAYRFEGSATAKGGFLYEAGGKLSTGPITAEVRTGTLKIARWSVASSLRGDLEAIIHPFDLQEPDGFRFFRFLTARADVKGQLDDVDFVRYYPALPFPVLLGGGEGPLTAKVALREGVVQAGSAVHYQTGAVQVSTHGYRFVGPIALDARWSSGTGDARLVVEAKVSPYKVTRVGNDKAVLGGKLATLRMDVAKFDLAQPAFEPFTHAQVSDGQLYDLRVLNDYVPRDLPLRLEAGTGTFSGRVSTSHKGQATAELEVGGEKAELVYDKVRLKGDWSVSATLSGVNLTTGEADVDRGLLLINDMAMREGAHARDGWFGRFELLKGHVRPSGPILLEGDLDTTMRDGRPLVAFFIAETEMLPVAARTLVTLQALRATARFRLGEGLLELDRLNARGQSIELRGRLRKNGEHQWGDMLVLSRGQEVGVALRGKRVEFKLLGAAGWFREQMLRPKW